MQKITPHLWYDKEASEAAAYYTSIFPTSGSRTGQRFITRLRVTQILSPLNYRDRNSC